MGVEWRGPCEICHATGPLGSFPRPVPCDRCWAGLSKTGRDCWAAGIDPRPTLWGWAAAKIASLFPAATAGRLKDAPPE